MSFIQLFHVGTNRKVSYCLIDKMYLANQVKHCYMAKKRNMPHKLWQFIDKPLLQRNSSAGIRDLFLSMSFNFDIIRATAKIKTPICRSVRCPNDRIISRIQYAPSYQNIHHDAAEKMPLPLFGVTLKNMLQLLVVKQN